MKVIQDDKNGKSKVYLIEEQDVGQQFEAPPDTKADFYRDRSIERQLVPV